MRGLHSAPAGLSSQDQGTAGWRQGQAANLSTLCPSNHLQAQVTAESRAKCGCAPLPDLQPRLPTPDPGERTPVSARTDGAAPLVPATPGPSARHLAQVGRGGGTSPRLRGTGSTLRPTHRLRGGSLPTPSPPSPCSHLGASLVGPEAGAETPGRPPAGLVHDLPGVERAPPECGLRPPHGVNAPQSRLLEGERGGCEGPRGGKRRCCALAHCGELQGGAEAPGPQLSAPALPGPEAALERLRSKLAAAHSAGAPAVPAQKAGRGWG